MSPSLSQSGTSLLSLDLHVSFLLHAGGLWRDEVVSFNVATQPTLAQVHEAVRFDSFPSFFHLLLRGWLGLVGSASDLGTRGLGLLIGLAVLAAFWWNARVFRSRIPLFSLLLLGISGLCVRTTDAIRAYGILRESTMTATRTFFLIDPQGVLRRKWIIENPSTTTVYSDTVLQGIREVIGKQ